MPLKSCCRSQTLLEVQFVGEDILIIWFFLYAMMRKLLPEWNLFCYRCMIILFVYGLWSSKIFLLNHSSSLFVQIAMLIRSLIRGWFLYVFDLFVFFENASFPSGIWISTPNISSCLISFFYIIVVDSSNWFLRDHQARNAPLCRRRWGTFTYLPSVCRNCLILARIA